MPVRKKKQAKRWSMLEEDRTAHVTMGWCLDCPNRFGYPLNFPFKDEAARRRYWFDNRAALVARFGAVEKMVGWRDYEATDEQKAAFRRSETPNAYRYEEATND